MIIPFATQSYKSPALPLSAQRLINAWAEKEPQDTKSQVAVFGLHGQTLFATCGVGPIRGMRVFNGVLHVVSGGTLYSVTRAGVVTALGGVISGAGPVSMSDNGIAGLQLIMVNGTAGYIYTVAGGFQAIIDPNFTPANTVTFFDSYFVFDRVGKNQFFLSNVLDGTTYQASQFNSADGQSGNVVSIVNQQNVLMIFGETHMETWWDSGAANFPFLRYIGATVERGCIGAFSVAKDDNSVFFFGEDMVYYRLDGTIPHRISNHAIEAEWRTYSVVTDVNTFSYTWNGHKFLVVTFPTARKTWVYDISTGLWHERVSWDINGNSLGRWRPSCHVTAYGQELFGDSASGQIGMADSVVQTELGNTIQCQMISPPIHEDRCRLFFDELNVDIEVGQGTTTGSGVNPQVLMDVSDDGGYTFKNQRQASMGALGAYNDRTRCRWTRMGNSRQRVFRLIMADPVPKVLISANARVRKSKS